MIVLLVRLIHETVQRYKLRWNSNEKKIARNIKKSKKSYSRVTRTDIDNYIPKFYKESYESQIFTMPADDFCQRVNFAKLKESHNHIFDGDFCVICLEVFESDDELIILPCDHYLHYDCLFTMRQSQIRQMRNNMMDEPIRMRCPLCQLNLVRHYIFYKENMLDPKTIKFYNKE